MKVSKIGQVAQVLLNKYLFETDPIYMNQICNKYALIYCYLFAEVTIEKSFDSKNKFKAKSYNEVFHIKYPQYT